MNYCLSKEEFHIFFDVLFSKQTLEDNFEEDLQMRVDSCMSWDDRIGIILYFFTHFIQKKVKSEEIQDSLYIDQLYELVNVGNFVIESFNSDFIIYMSNYSRSRITEDLPDSLTLIMQNYLDRSYDSSFCF